MDNAGYANRERPGYKPVHCRFKPGSRSNSTNPCRGCNCLAVRIGVWLRALATLWFALAVTPLWAKYEYPFSCAVEVRNGTAGGSAAVVGVAEGRCLLLSCAHLFEGEGRAPEVRFPDSAQWFRARVLAVDSQLDLSAMDAPDTEVGDTARRVRVVKNTDDVLTTAGYPYYCAANKGPNYTRGRLLRIAEHDVYFAAKPVVHSGFSGAGLFAPDGSLVGIVHGYNDERESIACGGPAFTKFAARWVEVAR